MKAIGTNSSINDSDTTLFGECLKLPYYRGPVEDWMVATNGFLIAVNLVSALITIVANTVFLLTYFKTRPLRTPHNFFLMLLAITDISVGLISQPLFVSRKIMETYRVHNCVLWTAMRATVYYFSGISFLTLTLVGIERYMAVCYPIKHRNAVTENRMAVIAFLVWATWLLFPIMRFALSKFYKAFGMLIGGIILVLFAVNAYFYVKIYRCAVGKVSESESQIRKTSRTSDVKKEVRLAKTVGCLMVVMVLAYLPTAMGLAYKAMVGIDTTYLFVFLPIADTLVLINSTFNPLFYCYKNKNIREAIYVLFVSPKKLGRGSSTTLDCIDSRKVQNSVSG